MHTQKLFSIIANPKAKKRKISFSTFLNILFITLFYILEDYVRNSFAIIFAYALRREFPKAGKLSTKSLNSLKINYRRTLPGN